LQNRFRAALAGAPVPRVAAANSVITFQLQSKGRNAKVKILGTTCALAALTIAMPLSYAQPSTTQGGPFTVVNSPGKID
jgi:hypothetical protein